MYKLFSLFFVLDIVKIGSWYITNGSQIYNAMFYVLFEYSLILVSKKKLRKHDFHNNSSIIEISKWTKIQINGSIYKCQMDMVTFDYTTKGNFNIQGIYKLASSQILDWFIYICITFKLDIKIFRVYQQIQMRDLWHYPWSDKSLIEHLTSIQNKISVLLIWWIKWFNGYLNVCTIIY